MPTNHAAAVAETVITDEPWSDFRRDLLADGILLTTGVDGIYGRSATYESIVGAVDALAVASGADLGATNLRFPPVMPWATFEKNGYLESFPDQMGSVHSFRGSEQDHTELLRRTSTHEDRGPLLDSTDIVLCPAACHPLYPTQSGVLPEGGRIFEIVGYCFRHEPSTDPFRMQSFRQHEFVYLGTPEGARAHRDQWIGRGLDVLIGLGLEVESVVANDPFFGRSGRMLAANQRIRGTQVRADRSGVRRSTADGHLVVQLPPRPLRASLRHHHGRR